jgi:hypothetical protein
MILTLCEQSLNCRLFAIPTKAQIPDVCILGPVATLVTQPLESGVDDRVRGEFGKHGFKVTPSGL